MLSNQIRMWMRRAWPVLGVLAALASAPPTAEARQDTPPECAGTIHSARYVPNGRQIFVSLNERINEQDLNPGGAGSKWTLADLSSQPVKDIPVLKVEPDRVSAATFTSLVLSIGEPLVEGNLYRLAALNLTILGCTPKERGTSDITFLKPSPNPTPPSTSTYFPPSKSKGRDDSNVYIQGSLEGARGGKAQFSSDVKIDIPYSLNASGTTDIGPYFNMKASTAEDADANTISTGVKFSTRIYKRNSGFLRNIVYSPTVGIEGDRRFKNLNGVVGHTLYFATAGNEDTFTKRIYFQPFVGYEIGRKFRSPVEEAEGSGISRLSVGGSLYFTVPLKDDKAFSIQTDYVRRFLLRRERTFEEDDDSNLVFLSVGKGPRDYVKTTLQYDFAKFTALTLSHEYGRLPPNFDLVNHKYSLGLLLKFKTTFVQK